MLLFFQWVEVLSDFKQRDTVWGFVPGDAIHPLVLHLGDYNLDGFPDALVILRNTSGRSEEKTYQRSQFSGEIFDFKCKLI